MAKHVCPVWVGHLLASPLRKLLNNPKSMLGKHVIKDMIALDIGCARFSIVLSCCKSKIYTNKSRWCVTARTSLPHSSALDQW